MFICFLSHSIVNLIAENRIFQVDERVPLEVYWNGVDS
jgi:hypothetical protein